MNLHSKLLGYAIAAACTCASLPAYAVMEVGAKLKYHSAKEINDDIKLPTGGFWDKHGFLPDRKQNIIAVFAHFADDKTVPNPYQFTNWDAAVGKAVEFLNLNPTFFDTIHQSPTHSVNNHEMNGYPDEPARIQLNRQVGNSFADHAEWAREAVVAFFRQKYPNHLPVFLGQLEHARIQDVFEEVPANDWVGRFHQYRGMSDIKAFTTKWRESGVDMKTLNDQSHNPKKVYIRSDNGNNHGAYIHELVHWLAHPGWETAKASNTSTDEGSTDALARAIIESLPGDVIYRTGYDTYVQNVATVFGVNELSFRAYFGGDQGIISSLTQHASKFGAKF